MYQNPRSSIVPRAGDPLPPLVDWPSPAGTPGQKLRDVGRALLRRRKLIAAIVLLLNALAIVAVTRMTPRYTAQADLMISPRQQQVVDLKAVLSGLSGETEVVESEIQVLRSREIARIVVQQLDLDDRAEFNPALDAPGLGERVAAFVPAWARELARSLTPGPADPATPAPEAVRDPLSAPVDAFLRRLGVTPRGRSRVISVGFDSADPALAAAAANAAADAYIANQLKAKQEATIKAHKWLNDRVAELREQVLNADAAVESFRRRAGLTQGRGGSLLAEQITEIGDQIIKAKAAEADAEAKLQAASANGRLRAQGLEQAQQAARQRVVALEAAFVKLRDQASAGNQSEVQLRALQHEADADRALYDRLLARLKETRIESGLQTPDAQIISRAEPPSDPTFPKLGVIVPMVFVASALFAGLIALLLESFDRGYATPDQAEQHLGVPVIGVMPRLKHRLRGGGDPGTYVVEHPGSRLSEAVRGLHTSLMLSGADRPPKVVLFASAFPEEGKSSSALALARLAACGGKRVVVVDCDVRHGQLSEACGTRREPGLTDFLSGRAPIEAILHRDTLSPANVVSAGPFEAGVPDMLGSEKMRQVLAALSECFDLVVLDSAPLLLVSDTRGLCRLADKVVLVVRWRNTKRAAAAAVLRQLLEAGADVAGCLLSMAGAEAQAEPGGGRTALSHRRAGLYLTP